MLIAALITAVLTFIAFLVALSASMRYRETRNRDYNQISGCFMIFVLLLGGSTVVLLGIKLILYIGV